MIITAKTKACANVVVYALGTTDSQGRTRPCAPVKIYGDVDEIQRDHTMTGRWEVDHIIVSDLTPSSDHLVSTVETEFMQELLAFALKGRDLSEFIVLIVQHPQPDGIIDIHFIISRLHLPRLTRDFSPFDNNPKLNHGKQFREFAEAMSLKFGLQNPEDPTIRENVQRIPRKKKALRNKIREIDEHIILLISEGFISSFNDVVAELVELGLTPEFNLDNQQLIINIGEKRYEFKHAKYRGEESFQSWRESLEGHDRKDIPSVPNPDPALQQTINRLIRERAEEIRRTTKGVGYFANQDMRHGAYIGLSPDNQFNDSSVDVGDASGDAYNSCCMRGILRDRLQLKLNHQIGEYYDKESTKRSFGFLAQLADIVKGLIHSCSKIVTTLEQGRSIAERCEQSQRLQKSLSGSGIDKRTIVQSLSQFGGTDSESRDVAGLQMTSKHNESFSNSESKPDEKYSACVSERLDSNLDNQDENCGMEI